MSRTKTFSDAPSDGELNALRRKADTYPTDLTLRYELGSALLARGDFDRAISELLRAQRSPHVRVSAMRLLIQAYEAKGMTDRADQLRKQLSRETGDNNG